MPAPERNPLGRFLALSAALHVALAVGLRVDVPRARELREPVRVRVVDLVEPEEFLKRLSPREPEVLSRFSARASGRARPSPQPKLAASETRIPSPSLPGGPPAPSVAPQELRGIPLAALPRPGEAAPLPRPRALVEPVPRNLPPEAPSPQAPPASRARLSPSASALPAPPREGAAPRVAPREGPAARRAPSPPAVRRVEPERPSPARRRARSRPPVDAPAAREARKPLPAPAREAAPETRVAPRERADPSPVPPPRRPPERVEVARVEPSRPVKPAEPARPSDPLALIRRPTSARPDLGKRPSREPDLSLTPEDLAALPQQHRKEEALADEGEAISLNTQEFKYVSYFAHIKRKIEMAWNYPEEAQRRGIAGKLMVKFVLREDGELVRLKLLRPSDYPILDEEALSAIAKAAPFNPIPKSIGRRILPINAEFEYVLSGFIQWRMR